MVRVLGGATSFMKCSLKQCIGRCENEGIGPNSKEAELEGTILVAALQLLLCIQSSAHMPTNYSHILSLFNTPPPIILKDATGSIVFEENRVGSGMGSLEMGDIDWPSS